MSEIKDKLLEKINYLEKNRDVILERLLSIGECSYYEKFKKDCGIKISILDKLIELGKQYEDKDLSEKNQEVENDFEDKAYEILNSIDTNDNRDVIIEISSFEENKESEDFMNDLIMMYQKYSEQKKWKHTLISSESKPLPHQPPRHPRGQRSRQNPKETRRPPRLARIAQCRRPRLRPRTPPGHRCRTRRRGSAPGIGPRSGGLTGVDRRRWLPPARVAENGLGLVGR